MSTFGDIALVTNAQIRFLMLDIAREFGQRHGSGVHLYCWTPEQLQFYESKDRDGWLASINLAPAIHNLAVEPVTDAQSEVDFARRVESEIGRTYGSLAVANRHLGRGYALAGFYHPRSNQAINSDDLGVIHAYNQHFAYWRKECRDKKLRLILGGPAEMPPAARRERIPYRKLAGSRHGNFHFWTINEYNESDELKAKLAQFKTNRPESIKLDKPYDLVGVVSSQFLKELSLASVVQKLGTKVAQRVYWSLRSYEKAKGYRAWDELAMIFRRWREARRLVGRQMARLDDLKGQPFIFFPLATEPETSLQQFSPEFFFQHAAIAALSRDLPAGVKLVVKESNVGVGRRPDNFYDQIAELKNVVWMNILEPGHAVAQHATAVAVITGSTGFEAAISGTPVISFGRHNPYNALPHVFHVTDLAETGPIVKHLFDNRVDLEKAGIDGARYLNAVVATSFDLGPYDYVDLHKYTEKEVAAACDALERSLSLSHAGASAPARQLA